jgi:cell division septation protein DedD
MIGQVWGMKAMVQTGTNWNRATLALCAVVALASAGALPARADVKEGVDAWARGDYDAAVAQWQGPAAKGDPDAMFNMGQAYKLGRGVAKDVAKAEDYYHRAAQKGHIRAADNYGILLFQTNRQAEAMPWLNASADRGEPRAMYILGIAAYNGDYAPKDLVRAYALMTRAAQAGLQQAVNSLAAMNDAIPIEQRQQGVALAEELDRKAVATRASEMGSADLGGSRPAATAEAAPVQPFTPAAPPATDYAQAAPVPVPRPRPFVEKPERPAPAPRPAVATASGGSWRVQLGAFGQKANADALWAKLRSRPEIAGHPRIDAGTGVARLLAGGYSEAEANRACAGLKAAGLSCLVTSH